MEIRCAVYFYVTVIIVCLPTLTLSQTADTISCTTYPDRQPGVCIPLQQCQHQLSLLLNLQNSELSHQDRMYFRNNQCGFEKNTVLICCSSRTLPADRILETTRPTVRAQPRPPPPLSQAESQSPTAPSRTACGTWRSISGDNSNRNRFPWLALIEYTSKVNGTTHFCGGTLIDNRYVLTAAHCAKPNTADWSLTGVRLGEWDTTTNPDCFSDTCAPAHQDIPVDTVIIHPEYNSLNRNQQHDIALLKLNKTVAYNDYVSPICLPISNNLKNNEFTDAIMDTAGWGSFDGPSNQMLKSSVQVWNITKCQGVYFQQRISLTASQMCAIAIERNKCGSDSGGPLMYYTGNGNVVLAGLLSFGPKQCGTEGWPDVYTRVGAYFDWIRNVVNTY